MWLRRVFRLLAFIPALCAGWEPVLGQSADLVTDRPDQTESAVTVAPGYLQVETGVLLTRDNSAGRDLEATELLGTLVRIGISERVELRVGFDGFVSEEIERPAPRGRVDSDGFGDASLGAKLLLFEEDAARPQAAMLIESSVPIGESEVSSDDYEPSVRLALSKDLRNGVSIGWNGGLAREEGDDILFYTLAAGFGLTDKNGAFLEVFGDSDDSHSIDVGWTYLVTPAAQLDLAVGAGLSSEAPNWFLGAGISLRFPD